MSFKKGDKIKIENDTTLAACGYGQVLKSLGHGNVVYGEVFTVDDQGEILGFIVAGTNTIECIDDGIVTNLTKIDEINGRIEKLNSMLGAKK